MKYKITVNNKTYEVEIEDINTTTRHRIRGW